MDNNIKEKIMDVSKELFLKKGYKETKITDIARQMHISPSTIYLYFDGKKDLFDSLDIPEAKVLQPEHDARRNEIVRIALLLFGEKGFDGTSMNMIAKRAGISKASLYQYFDDKDNLFAVVMKETPFHYNFHTIEPDINTTDFRTIVYKIGKAYMSIFDTPERIAFTRTILRDSNKHPEISNMYHKNGLGYVAQCLADVMESYKDQLRTDIDFYLAAKTYVGSLFAFVIQYKVIIGVNAQYSDDEILDASTDIFLRGVLKN
ncbi:MAG: TetR/AcrR family transcriptional regulator [Lachnospiraceae bacterium]|jgi:AcrR family transcriptional regulator|nr:TetR/AcrR family transcriptional regulator [Lachnospiraceae bacterium]MCI1656875.1 TetR/AcrR family transcriptional regulator [Lachnospiraceae bacterium]MCI2195119.1 TetR/AcrR family transcriptional regulator [Lachnospiraceae bacterium]